MEDQTTGNMSFIQKSFESLSLQQANAKASKASRCKQVVAKLKDMLAVKSELDQASKERYLEKLLELDGKVLLGMRTKDDDKDAEYWTQVGQDIEEICKKIVGKSGILKTVINQSQVEASDKSAEKDEAQILNKVEGAEIQDKQTSQQEVGSSLAVEVSDAKQEEVGSSLAVEVSDVAASAQIVDKMEKKQSIQIGRKEKAAVELLQKGANFELVQTIMGPGIDLKDIERAYMSKIGEGMDESELLKISVDLLSRSESVKKDDEFFEKLLEQAESDPNKNYIDPIFYNVMVDPVLLSSGQVMDRKTILDDNGNLKYENCPLTRQRLEPKVYPVSFLKSELKDWLINRFRKILYIAEQYRDQKDKFEKVCDKLETALKNLGEDLYKGEASKFANLLLSSPYLNEPETFAKCYIRVFKTMSAEEKETTFVNQVMQMKDNAIISLDSGDMEKAKKWLDACDKFNQAKTGKTISISSTWLSFYKKSVEKNLNKDQSLSMIKVYQMKVYQTLSSEENSEAKIREFLEKEGITKEELIDTTPVKLIGKNIRINESTEDPKLLHAGAKVDWTPRSIKVDADWTDQGFGNKKSRLWLLVYRNDEIVLEHDIFGICQRNDPTQKTREYTVADDIVNKALPGDTYQIYGRSGGGGGHQLRVKSINVTISAFEDNTLEPKVYGPNGNQMSVEQIAVSRQEDDNVLLVVGGDEYADEIDYDGALGDDDDDY